MVIFSAAYPEKQKNLIMGWIIDFGNGNGEGKREFSNLANLEPIAMFDGEDIPRCQYESPQKDCYQADQKNRHAIKSFGIAE